MNRHRLFRNAGSTNPTSRLGSLVGLPRPEAWRASGTPGNAVEGRPLNEGMRNAPFQGILVHCPAPGALWDVRFHSITGREGTRCTWRRGPFGGGHCDAIDRRRVASSDLQEGR